MLSDLAFLKLSVDALGLNYAKCAEIFSPDRVWTSSWVFFAAHRVLHEVYFLHVHFYATYIRL